MLCYVSTLIADQWTRHIRPSSTYNDEWKICAAHFFQASPLMAPDKLLIILFRSLASYTWLKCFLCRITTNISYYQVVPNPFCRPTICGWISPQSIMHETWATGSTKGPGRRLEIRGSRWAHAAAKNHQLGFTSTNMLTTNITFNTDNQSQFSNTMGVALSFHDTSNSTSFFSAILLYYNSLKLIDICWFCLCLSVFSTTVLLTILFYNKFVCYIHLACKKRLIKIIYIYIYSQGV